MDWIAVLQLIYFVFMLFVLLRVLYDTRSGSKTLAYVLFIVFFPIVGILFYFSFGVNYRKRKMYSKKIIADENIRHQIQQGVGNYTNSVLNSNFFDNKYRNLAQFIGNSNDSPLTANNTVKLLINGEQKFPIVLQALAQAKYHIHLEYYIYENDITGNSIIELLIEKAKQGLEVRFLYDDFGSHRIDKALLKIMADAGVKTAPFYKIRWYSFASQLNYRNHRKIIVIDGDTSFVGGINISDKYRNDLEPKNKLFWRDSHLMLKGNASFYLQYLFMCDWNFCSKEKLNFGADYFPQNPTDQIIEGEIVQIASSGPDSKLPVIFYSLMEAIGTAKNSICITSPYFIPGESLMDALIIAATSGVSVKILVPGISDSKMANAAAHSYYTELLQQGVRIFKYQKGFIHAKTMTVDDGLAIVGSANMDYRSFDLNFEVNAVLYREKINGQMREAFDNDLLEAVEIKADEWLKRPKYVQLWEKFVRLLSPFL
ncbi:cardiolipin synthase [Pedobacter arcticus]|uniref:cardiolipin synthase n=1 Tax=Pedobacter arcticus TaxID=752140 RepID=UPI0003763AEF|nr:cardiolipin synthase [Pedobacter arcticus]